MSGLCAKRSSCSWLRGLERLHGIEPRCAYSGQKGGRTRNGKSETSRRALAATGLDSEVGSWRVGESDCFIGSLLTDVEDPQQTSASVRAIVFGQNRIRRLLNFEGAGPDD
jgi:hypothetical protein